MSAVFTLRIVEGGSHQMNAIRVLTVFSLTRHFNSCSLDFRALFAQKFSAPELSIVEFRASHTSTHPNRSTSKIGYSAGVR